MSSCHIILLNVIILIRKHLKKRRGDSYSQFHPPGKSFIDAKEVTSEEDSKLKEKDVVVVAVDFDEHTVRLVLKPLPIPRSELFNIGALRYEKGAENVFTS